MRYDSPIPPYTVLSSVPRYSPLGRPQADRWLVARTWSVALAMAAVLPRTTRTALARSSLLPSVCRRVALSAAPALCGLRTFSQEASTHGALVLSKHSRPKLGGSAASTSSRSARSFPSRSCAHNGAWGTDRATRALRDAGRPQVLYGPSDQKKKGKRILVHVARSDVEDALRVTGVGFENTVHELTIEGVSGGPDTVHYVTLRDLQLHPVTSEPLCVNFLRFLSRRPIKVPLRVVGEQDCMALRTGGWLNLWRDSVLCHVEEDWRMPQSLEVDVAGLDPKQHIRLDRITFPDGVTPAEGLDSEAHSAWAMYRAKVRVAVWRRR